MSNQHIIKQKQYETYKHTKKMRKNNTNYYIIGDEL